MPGSLGLFSHYPPVILILLLYAVLQATAFRVHESFLSRVQWHCLFYMRSSRSLGLTNSSSDSKYPASRCALMKRNLRDLLFWYLNDWPRDPFQEWHVEWEKGLCTNCIQQAKGLDEGGCLERFAVCIRTTDRCYDRTHSLIEAKPRLKSTSPLLQKTTDTTLPRPSARL